MSHGNAARVIALLAVTACSGADEDARAVRPADGSRFLSASYPDEFPAAAAMLPGELIARGDSLFHGVIGRANCQMCHGALLQGASEGTNLRDTTWHNGDGSHGFITSVINEGVSKPGHLTMPPRGGMPITTGDVEAIAAYVFWISRTPRESSAAKRAK